MTRAYQARGDRPQALEQGSPQLGEQLEPVNPTSWDASGGCLLSHVEMTKGEASEPVSSCGPRQRGVKDEVE